MPEAEIIVLANSLKMKGRCIAGVSTQSGNWVRPVTQWEHGELYPSDFGMDGQEPKPLDVVRFSYSYSVPEPAQPENVLIERKPWELVRRLDPRLAYAELEPLLSSGPDLLGGRDAGMLEEIADAGVEASLTLVEPKALSFETRLSFGKLKARATFDLDSQAYDLPVTDRVVKRRLLGNGVGTYAPAQLELGDRRVLLTVSLGQPFNATNWKLAAGCVPVL